LFLRIFILDDFVICWQASVRGVHKAGRPTQLHRYGAKPWKTIVFPGNLRLLYPVTPIKPNIFSKFGVCVRAKENG
jgi:hypothetical protein